MSKKHKNFFLYTSNHNTTLGIEDYLKFIPEIFARKKLNIKILN